MYLATISCLIDAYADFDLVCDSGAMLVVTRSRRKCGQRGAG